MPDAQIVADAVADIFDAVALGGPRTLTSAMIDSRDFLAAKRRQPGALAPRSEGRTDAGIDFNDHSLIRGRLDRVHAKHPGMVLLHGGSPKGAERIAACWADHRKVPQIAFRPDWTKHAKAAQFKRNDAMLEMLPIGSWCFWAPAFRAISPTRPRSLGWRSGGLGAPLAD